MNDYKELIEELNGLVKNTRGYSLPVDFFVALAKAADAIEQLVTDIDAVRKEKDAAIGYLKKYARRCRICAHFNKKSSEIGSVCKTCKNYDENFFEDHWEYGGAPNEIN